MYKSINFFLLLITLSTLHVSCQDVIPVENVEELVECIRNKVLERTNTYREIHKLESVKLDNEMNNMAQDWAIHLSTMAQFTHSPNNIMYGQNIALMPAMYNVGAKIVDLWYNCIAYVNVDDDESKLRAKKNVGPMTQILWKSTSEIGVGVAEYKSSNYIYVVVYYAPKGNVDGQYLQNLPEFSQEHIDAGKIELTYFNLADVKMFISNSEIQLSPTELGKYEQTGTQELVLSKLNEEFNSNTDPRGLSHAEANRIRNQIFNKSNDYRVKHVLPELKISKQLNDIAQNCANSLALNKQLDERPLHHGMYGEMRYKTSPTLFGDIGEMTIVAMYNQIRCVRENMEEKDFNNNREIKGVIQILWKLTTLIGAGVAIDEEGSYYIVVLFEPVVDATKSFLANLPKIIKKDIDDGEKAYEEFNKLMRIKVKSDTISFERGLFYVEKHTG